MRVNSPFSKNIVEDKFDDANVQRDIGEGWASMEVADVVEAVGVVVDGVLAEGCVVGEGGLEWIGGCVVGLVSKIWVRSTGLVHASSK